MQVDVRQTEKVIIIDLDGRLVAGTGDELLRGVLKEVLASGWKQILLNLSRVVRIDSAGVGELAAGHRQAQMHGADLRLVKVGGRVRNVLELSHLLPLLAVYDDEDQALAAFAADDGGGKGDSSEQPV